MGYLQTHRGLVSERTIIPPGSAQRGRVYELKYDSETATKDNEAEAATETAQAEPEVEEELDEGGALVLWRDERSSHLRDTTPRQSLDEAV